MKKVAVIDAGIGNFPSLLGAFLRVDVEGQIVGHPEDLKSYDFAVLPGVGHWGVASDRLAISGWSEAIRDHVTRGGRLLGVCLGMQLLGNSSDEGEGPGLGLIDFHTALNPELKGRFENLGWNRIDLINSQENWFGVGPGRAFYFTHKYSVIPNSPDVGRLKSIDFPGVVAAVQSDNVIGVQFHPERSGQSGLSLLSNLANWGLS